MSIDSISQISPAISQANTGDAVAILTLKKSLATQASAALQLIHSVPQAPSASNPPHLGQSVDVSA